MSVRLSLVLLRRFLRLHLRIDGTVPKISEGHSIRSSYEKDLVLNRFQRKETDVKKRILLLIMTVILTLFTVSAVSQAQEVDLNDLTDEQLLILLQTIMQKLQDGETEEPAEVPAVPETAEEPAPAVPAPAAEEEEAAFEIYENKKLLVQRLPDSLFVQPEDLEPEKTPKPPSKKHPPVNPPGTRPDPLFPRN